MPQSDWNIACIGPRFGVPADIIALMERMGKYLTEQGYTIKTGNAEGSDQAFARGGNQGIASRVHLYLPWPTYNKEAIHPSNRIITTSPSVDEATAAANHPAWEKLSQGVRKLMTRNVSIIRETQQVLYYRDNVSPGRGGTAFGVRLAERFSIPTVNLWVTEERERVIKRLEKAGY